jgi:hypothetical protein
VSCPQCGADTPQTATRCGSCGAQLNVGGPGPAPADAVTPAANAPVTPRDDIPSHMPMAIVATLASVACCCLPFGMIAIIPASMVAGRVEQGNISGARTMSGLALGWSILTLLVSLGSVSACMASSYSAVGLVRSILGV